MAAFATANDMAVRYDVRTLGDLLSDDGHAVSAQELNNNDYLKTLLLEATGEIKAALLRSQRYTSDELDAVISAGSDTAEYLKGICCELTFWKIWERKPYVDAQQRLQAKQFTRDTLESLRTGAFSLDVSRHQEAGTPKTDTVSSVVIQRDWGLFTDQARTRHFPRRRSYRNL